MKRGRTCVRMRVIVRVRRRDSTKSNECIVQFVISKQFFMGVTLSSCCKCMILKGNRALSVGNINLQGRAKTA